MSTPQEVSEPSLAEGCPELRAAMETSCVEAHTATAAQVTATERLAHLRRDLVTAQHRQIEAQDAADPTLGTDQKARAREAYERALAAAESEEEITEATAVWAHSIDRTNRSSFRARRAVSAAVAAVAEVETELHEAEREEQTARVMAEQAEAICLDARVRLAACEEGADAADAAMTSSEPEPDAPGEGGDDAGEASRAGAPLVIESLVSGDRRALELTADRIAEHTGLSTAEARLQLQELVDALVSTAAGEGFLVFDTRHRFWSSLSFEEARDVISALARLGFLFEPSGDWHAGRAPTPGDLSMALAYAGLDARNMRGLPGAEELRLLPQSMGVDAGAFLAAQAPELTVDGMVRLLGRRAAQLEPLWNEWGHIRPILLSDRHTLGSVPG